MAKASTRLASPLMLVLLLCLASCQPLFSVSTLDDIPKIQFASEDPGVQDVPTWRIGDKWVYSGTFDPTKLVTDSGVQASVGEIYGDTTAEVTAITERTVDNMSVLAYTLRTSANFDKSGVSLDGYSGNVYITFEQTEYLRVSDLSSMRSDLDLYIRFVPYGLSSLAQVLGDITISNTYSPVNEVYDFPLRANEQWTTTTTSSSAWSGSSDYITPFPVPTSDTKSTTWEVTDIGKPRNSYGETIGYGGCNASYELTSIDSNGDQSGYRWYCPETRNFAWLHTEDEIGLIIDFRLKRYMPLDSVGVDQYNNPGTRDDCLSVDLENEITALNTPMAVWVNASSDCFSSVDGIPLEIHNEAMDNIVQVVTASNGSAHAVMNMGDAIDSSSSALDWASHGIVARVQPSSISSFGNKVGSSTLTLDEYLVGLDLISSEDFAKVLRNRSGVVTELNSLSGWNILPADELLIEVAVQNRGITSSIPTTMTITHPDGQLSTHPLPSLDTYEAHKVNFTWIVPNDQAIGTIPVSWQADPDGDNSADANSTNNIAQLSMFVGRLPIPQLIDTSALTLENIQLVANGSYDEDGGDVSCLFNIPYDDGSLTWAWQSIPSSSCLVNWTWSDDGNYPVEVTVIDEERDEQTATLMVTIGNRHPQIKILSARSEAKVEHPITLYAFANDSDSEDVWPGVVDVHWPDAFCKEGYYTRVCTTTASTEGWHTFTAVATDDDYETTVATYDIRFTNIAPHGVSIALQKNNQFIESDEQQIWHLDEDEEVIVKGQALDSIDDLESLTHTWWPDGQQPSLMYTFSGRTSTYPMQWDTSGLHTIRLEVSDTDGEASHIEERWINIQNVPPVIEPLVSLLPIAEGQSITIVGNSTDTESDIPTLVKCWDIDPGIDSDDLGGADDDCDVRGDILEYAWNRSGSHTIVYHVTDDDGAQSSEVLTVEVLNMPPIVRLQNINCIAYRDCFLNAEQTIDSLNDLEGLTIVWDLDITIDSNGDGIKDNDADLVGSTVTHMFRKAGTIRVKAMAWDENPERPGQATMVVEVAPPERTSIEQVGAALIGDEANPWAQIGLLVATLLVVAMFSRRKKAYPTDEHWQQEGFEGQDLSEQAFEAQSLLDEAQSRRPPSPPSDLMFVSALETPEDMPLSDTIPQIEATTESVLTPQEPMVESQAPALPEWGLPEGWTEEQWSHYGQQYLDAQSSNS
ncbi:MAG: hypothetical protein HOL22_06980 [Euryarchaeota archaeon]|jgi:hypothetical protein|nr:hypothetical protein [Euryarchaeota archaeon]MBT5843566.1 hypothetical protein [Euryarchaeota archaeon]MBT6641104.1 hypothetical protein [Euryarchaeota archaeon]MBT7638250.1 hypothetical protein [Euryarchaeota archaeon]